MQRPVPRAIDPTAIVELRGVRKSFRQKQPAACLRDALRPRYRHVTALDDVSFTVAPGAFVAYAGPNGAGKSTTIKLLGGLLMQDAGEISVLGLSPDRHRIPIMRRMGILFGNRTELWWDHPVSTSYQWKRSVWDIPAGDFAAMEALVLDLLDIRPFYHTFARELSLGQRMRADLGMLLLHRPDLLLLDEPTLGLDVLAKRQMIAFLKNLNARQGTTVIVTSHDMDDLEEMARRVLLIAQGRVAFDGDFTGLRQALGCTRRATVRFADGTTRDYPFENAKELMARLAALDDIADIAFGQTSLEEGLATLFASWKRGEGTSLAAPD
ncbi:MAG: ATP-binding cassette domain-containing protein [Oscillospiraceae bacterium]|jgi:ABC-2 type transport system ATP-binding protein|nr:ATP-binding cassette domain-containing protein [Oscillospiraceae bacterium]